MPHGISAYRPMLWTEAHFEARKACDGKTKLHHTKVPLPVMLNSSQHSRVNGKMDTRYQLWCFALTQAKGSRRLRVA